LEDRAASAALLGSLINAGVVNRMTVLFDGGEAGSWSHGAGGRAADHADHADRADHSELRAELARIQELGYLID